MIVRVMSERGLKGHKRDRENYGRNSEGFFHVIGDASAAHLLKADLRILEPKLWRRDACPPCSRSYLPRDRYFPAGNRRI